MKKLLLLFLLLFAASSFASTTADSGTFTVSVIPDSIFEQMVGKSFPQNCAVQRSSLRYLRLSFWGKDNKPHVGEMICNKAIADDLVDIFKQLFAAKYPIERMELVDKYGANDEKSMTANNTSCFNFRYVSGTKTVSKHGQGMAVDVNPLYNPCVSSSGKIEPAAGKSYAYRRSTRKDVPMMIDRNDLCYKLFISHGFRWGGAWKSKKDYQHFQK